MVFLLFLGGSKLGLSQKSFGIEAAYVTGFQDRPLTVLGSPITSNLPHGFQFSLLFTNRIKKSSWFFNSSLGSKYVASNGVMDGDLEYSAKTLNINAMVGGHYRLKENFGVGLQFVLESNREFQDFIFVKANIFRYYLCAEASYSLTKKLEATFKYARSISSNQDVYLIYMPANQISVGLKYHLNEI
jgi:hypothetical protein